MRADSCYCGYLKQRIPTNPTQIPVMLMTHLSSFADTLQMAAFSSSHLGTRSKRREPGLIAARERLQEGIVRSQQEVLSCPIPDSILTIASCSLLQQLRVQVLFASCFLLPKQIKKNVCKGREKRRLIQDPQILGAVIPFKQTVWKIRTGDMLKLKDSKEKRWKK